MAETQSPFLGRDDEAWQQLGPQLMRALAMQPVLGQNVHAAPEGLHQAYLDEDPIQPIPLGSFSDPVSQAAFLLAPGARQLLKVLMPESGAGGFGTFGGTLLGSERGNLGRPPIGMRAGQRVPLSESVIRDEQGNLVRLYHGTNTTFPDFDLGYARQGTLYGKGIYLTDDPQVASSYATPRVGGDEAQVRPVYADIRQPFRAVGSRQATPTQMQAAMQLLQQWAQGQGGRAQDDLARLLLQWQRHGTSGAGLWHALDRTMGADEALRGLGTQGFDAVQYLGGLRMPTGNLHNVYVPFSSEQVYPSFSIDAWLAAQRSGQLRALHQRLLQTLSAPSSMRGQ